METIDLSEENKQKRYEEWSHSPILTICIRTFSPSKGINSKTRVIIYLPMFLQGKGYKMNGNVPLKHPNLYKNINLGRFIRGLYILIFFVL